MRVTLLREGGVIGSTRLPSKEDPRADLREPLNREVAGPIHVTNTKSFGEGFPYHGLLSTEIGVDWRPYQATDLAWASF